MILFWLYYTTFLFDFNPYKNVIGFLIDLKTPKRHFEINWPLEYPYLYSILDKRNVAAETVKSLGRKTDNFSLNWRKNPTYCVPKRKIKVHVTVQDSPKLRKKYKIKVTENMNVQNGTSKILQKGGGRETGI